MTVPIRVAVVQGESTASFSAALGETARLAERAATQGAKLVVFPETWIPGYPVWLDVCRDAALWDFKPGKVLYERYADACVDVRGAEGRALAELAASLGVVLVVGVSERVAAGPGRGTLYNSLLTFSADGTLANHHRKLMPTYSERMWWGAGDADGLHAVDTSVGRIGGLICWEHWMPLARQALHESGEDFHVAAWPTAHERNQIASRHYAFEGRCFVLVSASVVRASSLPAELESHPALVSSPDQWVVRGGSCIIGPDGNYVVEPVYDQEALLLADLDLGRIRQESLTLDVSGHYSRPDLLRLSVQRSARSTP